MGDDFLGGLAKSISDIERRAREHFGKLDYETFNWSSEPGRWSIGQCLEHLVKSNEPYFAIFDRLANGTHRATIWEQIPIWPMLWGKALYNTIKPENARKAKAPKIFQPTIGTVLLSTLDEFCRQQPRLIAAMSNLKHLDLEATIITSPVARVITYSLRDTFAILAAHEERHMRQAERVLVAMSKLKI